MWIPILLDRRQVTTSSGGPPADTEADDIRAERLSEAVSSKSITYVVIALLCVFSISFGIYLALRYLNRTGAGPSWLRWGGRSGSYARASSRADNDPINTTSSYHSHHRTSSSTTTGTGVDRMHSVRSIMTLPEYRPVAKPEFETTIAREGERGGVDVIVEFPETQEEEEGRRENHMQLLYEVRQARAIEREERRVRRDARRRGEQPPPRSNAASPSPRVQQLLSAGLGTNADTTTSTTNPRNRSASSTTTASINTTTTANLSRADLAALIAEPPARLSQVAYASLGYARPDGSRIRASSSERASSTPLLHSRNVSTTSTLMTLTTLNTGNTLAPSEPRIQSRSSSAHSFNTVNTTLSTPSHSASHSPSQSNNNTPYLTDEDDLHPHPENGSSNNGILQRRPTLPPQYDGLEFDEAPPYSSPVREGWEGGGGNELVVPRVRVTDGDRTGTGHR